jgi:hypothetical protein
MLQQRRQQEFQNQLATRDQALQEQNALAYQNQVGLQQKQFEANSERARREEMEQFVQAGIANLSAAQDPVQFARIADAVAADPRARELGITRDQITPESVAALRAQVKMAPPPAPPGPIGIQRHGGFSVLVQDGKPIPGGIDKPDAVGGVSEMYSPVDLAGGEIGAFDRRTGRIVKTGEKGRPKPNTQGMSLRKEFENQEAVKSYRTSLPLLVSARKAPDNGYGDLQLIYSAGKVLDPGSVVREGELALTIASGSPLQRAIGTTRFTIERGGRLTPETRRQILGMLNERVLAYRQAHDQERNRYASYASEAGEDPKKIVGDHPANAFQKQVQPPSQSAGGYSDQAKEQRYQEWKRRRGL